MQTPDDHFPPVQSSGIWEVNLAARGYLAVRGSIREKQKHLTKHGNKMEGKHAVNFFVILLSALCRWDDAEM